MGTDASQVNLLESLSQGSNQHLQLTSWSEWSESRSSTSQRLTYPRSTSAEEDQYSFLEYEDDLTEARFHEDGIPLERFDRDQAHVDTIPSHERSAEKRPELSFQQSCQQSTVCSSGVQSLRDERHGIGRLTGIYQSFVANRACESRQPFHRGRKSSLSVIMIILALYSTTFSGLFLFIGIRAPDYTWIGKGGSMSSYQAGLLTAFFAKTIEISFATVFVAFLGQIVSRKAFVRPHGRDATGKGITLAEMDLRSWVVQPGTMFTHFASFRSSVVSFLGIVSLIAAIVALLYTTASDALVQPNLRLISKHKNMQATVKSSFANTDYSSDNCATPISSLSDNIAGISCLVVRLTTRGSLDLSNYYATWSGVARNGNGSTRLVDRPEATSLLYTNTTVTGSWIEMVDTGENFRKHGRIINNITLAMPHAGIPAAAREVGNNIMQPEDQDKQNGYTLRASVPSPAINVLCASMDATELEPIVYTAWENNTLNVTLWRTGESIRWYPPGTYLNKTVVDDVFGWGKKYDVSPPVFAKYPIEYNTLLNHSGAYGRPAIYLLGKGLTRDYVLCSIKAFQTPYCSTSYTASSSGAYLRTTCTSKGEISQTDDMQYVRNLPSSGAGNTSLGWVSLASLWANGLNLNAGMDDGDSSNARILTQLALGSDELSPALPSLAEAIAVMAGSTLLMSSESAPFVEYWNYTTANGMLDPGQPQWFNATLQTQLYASGGNGEPGTEAFFIVLAAVFIINIVCLVYFIVQDGLITDFTEPLNLFSLSINSPPSVFMAGSCAAGPSKRHFGTGWFIDADGQHLYLQNKEDLEPSAEQSVPESPKEAPVPPFRDTVDRLSRRRTRWF